VPHFNAIAANIAVSDTARKTTFFGLHFCRRKYRCIFNHFYVMRFEGYRIRWNDSNLGAVTPFKVIQCRRVWCQSKAQMRLPISD